MFALIILCIVIQRVVGQVPIQLPPGVNTPSSLNDERNDVYDEIDKHIERPCETFDTFCIRKYFSSHSRCRETYGRVPETVYRQQVTSYLPRINVTVVFNDILYTGLNGRIEEFYINRKTDNLVLAVAFNNVTFSSDYAVFRYHRVANEPIVLSDKVQATLSDILITITIPNLKNLQLDRSSVFSYSDAAPRTVNILPGAFNVTDLLVIRSRDELYSDMASNMQEGQLTEAPFYMGTFIQYNICDFGLEFM